MGSRPDIHEGVSQYTNQDSLMLYVAANNQSPLPDNHAPVKICACWTPADQCSCKGCFLVIRNCRASLRQSAVQRLKARPICLAQACLLQLHARLILAVFTCRSVCTASSLSTEFAKSHHRLRLAAMEQSAIPCHGIAYNCLDAGEDLACKSWLQQPQR